MCSRRVARSCVNRLRHPSKGIRAAVRDAHAETLDARVGQATSVASKRSGDRRRSAAEALPGWEIVNDEALQKGRAGVAIISRLPARRDAHAPRPEPLDASGRWIETDFDIDGETVTIVSAYVHSGEVDTPKQDAKWLFLDAMERRLAELSAERELALVAGDLNVGHRELDIKNWRGNRKNAGFLPRERAYFDRFFGPAGDEVEGVDGSTGTGLGWIDVGRRAMGEVDGPYTFWSMRGEGVRHRQRLAHRLPRRHPRPGRAGHLLPRRPRALVRHALERPLPRHRRLHARDLTVA